MREHGIEYFKDVKASLCFEIDGNIDIFLEIKT
jgi:hypothetical protein